MSRTDDDVADLPLDSDYEYYGEYVDEEGFYGEEEEDSIYDSDDFISGPWLSQNCTLSETTLEFDFSYGYNCRKYFNIAVPDEDTIVFASGNFLNFFDVKTKTLQFRRSALGGGIGHIAVNPNEDYKHLAVAENGKKPLIIIYEWPSMEINCILREGSSKIYSYIDYSPDGKLLVSQGGEPDYLITVFNWPKHRILLRTKSYVNDVDRVKFSPYVPGQITTSGVGHVKFWKMARTFTGLKLKGDVGRFGKTEYSDILGVLPMPDEKVVSGCFWGNILVWEAGLIKLEVFRTLKRKCHEAPIVQFHYLDGELWTVGMDGHVRVWSYDKIDQADPPDEDRVVQIEPIYDFHVPGVMLMSIKKRSRLPDSDSSQYFAQDGNGGLWLIDLNVNDTPAAPQQLYACHGGPVTDIAACPWGTYLASVGGGGHIHLYNYLDKKLLFRHKFPATPHCMIWLPLAVQKTGDEIVIGFDDGTLRVILLFIEKTIRLDIIQITKPHNKPVAKISLNGTGEVLVSGGEDKTIFIFKVEQETDCVTLVPIGYIRVCDVPTDITWHYTQEYVVLVGCLHGHYTQVEVPKEPVSYTTISYLLDLKPINRTFSTYKAQIRRDIKIREIEAKKAEKVERKRKEMNKIKADNPGLEIDEEVYLADSESDEPLEPLHIPEVPNQILWLQSTKENTIWLSMAGYDAGYIYEYKIDQKEDVPYRFKMVDDADDTEIHSYLYTRDGRYLIFAMQDGSLRVNRVNPRDLRDLRDYWQLAVHDNINGRVPRMCLDHDERHLFTCGHDGNVFAYLFRPQEPARGSSSRLRAPRRAERTQPVERPTVEDADHRASLSLEEAMVKAERDRIQRLADRHKEAYRKRIKVLEERFYRNVLHRNDKLLPSQVIPQEELELDHRITEYVDRGLQANLDLVKRKLAFDVEKSEVGRQKLVEHFIAPLEAFVIVVSSISEPTTVKTIRQRRLDPQFYEVMKMVEQKIIEDELRGRPPERPVAVPKPPPPKKKKDRQIEFFLMTLSPTTIEKRLGSRLMRLLAKYRHRKNKWEDRQEVWDEFLAKKPQVGGVFTEDEAQLAEAEAAIGDYKLKSSPGYRVPAHLRETTVKKYKQLLLARERQKKIRFEFNEKVYKLRDRKVSLRETVNKMKRKLEEIQLTLPESFKRPIPEFPDDDGTEFPENMFAVVVEVEGSETSIENEPVAQKIVQPPDYDALELEVLPARVDLTDIDFEPLKDESIRTVKEMTIEQLVKASSNRRRDTPWEMEMRVFRRNRKLHEQSEIIEQIESYIEDFNRCVATTLMNRQKAKVDGNFIDLHILFLHQELIVLNDFESVEVELSDKVNSKLAAVMDMQDVINELNVRMREYNQDVSAHNEQISAIQLDFRNATNESKWFDFLRRVFRKKYKPPKEKKDESSSESSSSSSSEESDEADDAGSIDSRDFGIIKQDLNVCPKGCDPALYDLSVSLRTQRHQAEVSIKESLKNIEFLKKDVEIASKKIKIMQQNLKQSQDELTDFQRKKQQKMNRIQNTVVLKFDQLKNLDENDELLPIERSVLFSKTKLSQLYKRVGELQAETLRQNQSHSTDLKHLARMKTDVKFMQKKTQQLKTEVVQLMLTKFGKVVDIIEIEEALLKRTFGKDDISDLAEVLLKRLVLELRLSLMDVKGMYLEEMTLWRDKVRKSQEELTQTLKDNTTRMELLTLLSEEKTKLARELEAQKKKISMFEDISKTMETHTEENKKLLIISQQQNKEMQELKQAIKRLKTKGLQPAKEPEVVKRIRIPKQEEETDAWTDYERYLAQHRSASPEEWETEVTPREQPEIIMPFVPAESEEAARSIIADLLDNLGALLTKKSIENVVRGVLHVILSRGSINDIVKQLINDLPIEVSEDRMSIVRESAEKLSSLHETEVTEEEVDVCCREIMEEVMHKVTLETSTSAEFIYFTVQEILEHLPFEMVRKESNISFISDMLKKAFDSGLEKSDFMKYLSTSPPSKYSREMASILDSVLEKVYGSGLDYLYYIGDPASHEELYTEISRSHAEDEG